MGDCGEPAEREEAAPVNIPEPPPKKSPGKALIAVLAVAVVVLAGVVVWLAVRGSADDDSKTQFSASSTTEEITTLPQLNYSVGDTVQFGPYDWRVLNVQNGKALLLSEDIIEQRAYNSEYTEITWEACTLRAYLNGEFFEKFNEEDRTRIALTRNENPDNTWGTVYGERYNTPGGVPTDDYIFLLSVPEILKYYPGLKLDKDSDGDEWYYEADERLAAKFNINGSWWWLRSPGKHQNYAAIVDHDGHVNLGGDAVDDETDGVRPALWVEATAIAGPAAVTTTTQPTTTTQKPATTTPDTKAQTNKEVHTNRYGKTAGLSGTYRGSYGKYLVFQPDGIVTMGFWTGIKLDYDYYVEGRTVHIPGGAEDGTLTMNANGSLSNNSRSNPQTYVKD